MSEKQIDFLGVMERGIATRDEFIEYISSEVERGEIEFNDNLNIVGSVSGYNRDIFKETLKQHFNVVEEEENLLLLWAPKENLSYYVTIDEVEFPIFFTNANKTDEIPETVGEYLKNEPAMSRMWVGKREMERLRKKMVGEHENLIIPEFTAKRSKYSDIPAKVRPDYDRTMRNWSDDGLDVFRHFKSRYGVLPTNIQFEDPESFKVQVTQEGVFTSINKGFSQLSNLIDDTINRLRFIKSKIDTADYQDEVSPEGFTDISFPYSKPWAIKLDGRPTVEDIEHFRGNIAASNFRFKLLEYDYNKERRSFAAELMDKENYGLTDLKTKEDAIRVYPNGPSFIDESIRIYNFVDDHIDPDLQAIEVV